MERIFLVLSILLFAPEVYAHGGRLDANGCHTNKKTGEYHCHGGGRRTYIAPINVDADDPDRFISMLPERAHQTTRPRSLPKPPPIDTETITSENVAPQLPKPLQDCEIEIGNVKVVANALVTKPNDAALSKRLSEAIEELQVCKATVQNKK